MKIMQNLSKRTKITILILVLLFAFFYIRKGCSGNFIAVRIVPLQQGELTASVTAIGTIKPANEVVVRAQTDGIIDTVLVKEGTGLEEGSELLYLDTLSGRIVIKSPITGTVLLIPETTEKGASVVLGQNLLTVGSLRNLIIEADINEMEAKDLRKGQLVTITSDAYRDKKFSGRVKSIAPQVHEIDGVAKIPIVIDVLSYSPFKPGNKVDVEIITDQKKNAVYLPLEAVINRNGEKMVYLIDGNRAVEHKIETGISNIDYIEIISDAVISKESKVIVSDNAKLKGGTAVKIIK